MHGKCLQSAAQGCSVQNFSGSVSNDADFKNVVSSAEKPFAGVLQAFDVSFKIQKLLILADLVGHLNSSRRLLCQKYRALGTCTRLYLNESSRLISSSFLARSPAL